MLDTKLTVTIILMLVISGVAAGAYIANVQPINPKPALYALSFTDFTYEITHEYSIYSSTPTRYQVNFILTNTKHSDGTVHNVTLTYGPWSPGYWVNGTVYGEWISGQMETISLGDINVGQSIPVRMHDIPIRDIFTSSNGNAGFYAFYFEFRSSDYLDQGTHQTPRDYEYIEVKYYDQDKMLDAALSSTSFGGEEPVRLLCWSNPP